MKYLNFIGLLGVMALLSCNFENKAHIETPLIPRPQGIFPVASSFHLNEKTVILLENNDERLVNLANRLKIQLDSTAHTNLKIAQLSEAEGMKNIILLSAYNASERLEKGGYHIEVDKDKVVVQGQEFDGIANGISTLQQIVLLQQINGPNPEIVFPDVQMWDEPVFKYRGMHLDVGRHFFPASFIKKYLDIMALYKFNYFHWHLTEDQGWRIEIKAFPRLTEIGAWRVDENGQKYGGFYTQDEVREVVEYAKNLNITVIPEIEMPGHSNAAIAAYPNLSCTGKQIEVPDNWGVMDDVFCAGNEETYAFLETVLSEVIELFPAEYIHIGGDECPKTRWEKCSKCQNKMKTEGLANEHELQSYFITRMEKYLNAHGKKLIGWDEILEGGLAPEATVMSWRGVQGGIEAAQQEHDVIMTPTDYCYFDYYQGEPAFEPKAIGGYLPISKVYAFNPIPDVLNEEQKAFIMGGQGNMWTEYMATTDHVEYMLLPRMLALSEALWTKESKKDFDDFNERLQSHKKLLKLLGYNYSEGSFMVKAETSYDTATNENKVVLKSEQFKPEIRYTESPALFPDSARVYKSPFSPKNSCTITAGVFVDGKLQREATQFEYVHHLGLGQELKLLKKSSWRYGGETNAGLIDGIRGSDNFRDGRWAGFDGKDIVAEIEFNTPTDVNGLEFNYIHHQGAWILPPKSVTVSVRKANGNYEQVSQKDLKDLIEKKENAKGLVSVDFKAEQIVALKIHIENYKKLPAWHEYAGEESWLFADEIVVK